MTSTLDHIYRSIPQALSEQCSKKLDQWRSRAAPGLDRVGRKVVTGVALLPLGIMSIVETTMSLALAIFTAPAEIVGIHFSSLFLNRANEGGTAACCTLILFPITNIFRKKLDSIDSDAISTPFSVRAIETLVKWRFNSHPTGLDKGMRMAAMGVGLPVLGVLGCVETIMSFALGILTAPVAIVGLTVFPKSFFRRAYVGVFISSLAFTLIQLANLNIKVSKVEIPEYKSLKRVYKVIKTPLSQRAAWPLKKWRNQGAPGVDKTVRTIVRGVALGALEITSLIESIASFALGLLATPAEIAGIRFSTHFFKRAHTLLQFSRLAS